CSGAAQDESTSAQSALQKNNSPKFSFLHNCSFYSDFQLLLTKYYQMADVMNMVLFCSEDHVFIEINAS
ncbi:MAG: hypothetical protein Q4C20_04945, partial [Erysipelotrichaceae bacterium]|nr:hypothetical protein [Erysipelotrichaceae bacterium]